MLGLLRSLYSSSNGKVTASVTMTNTNIPVSCSASSRRVGVFVCSESRQHLCFSFIFSRTNICTCLASSVENVTQAFHGCVSAAVARVSRVVINIMPRPCFTFVVTSNSLLIVSHAPLSTATPVFHVCHLSARVSTLANNKQRPCLIHVIASYSRTCLTRCEQPATPLFDSVPWPQLYQHHAVLLSFATGLYVGPTLVLSVLFVSLSVGSNRVLCSVSIIRFTFRCRLGDDAL